MSPLPQTASPTVSWQGVPARSGIFPSDPQIAVSRTHVVVTTNDTIGFYDRAGQSLQAFWPGNFFQPLGLEGALGIDSYFDTRTIFDSYRNRFWVGALAYNSAHASDGDRLTKFVVGVSLTENPLDGWFLYWWDAVAYDGLNDGVVNKAGDAGDYPSMGVDGFGIYQTNAVGNSVSGYRYWHVVFFPADQLANGTPAGGWQYWGLTQPDGRPAGLIQPTVHHGGSTAAYFAGLRYGDIGSGGCGVRHDGHLLVWALTNPLQPTQQIALAEVTGLTPFTLPCVAPQKTPLGQPSSKPIEMRNLGNDVLKSVYRSGRLHVVMNDAVDWFHDGRILDSIRVIRIDVRQFPSIPTTPQSGFIDRVFGANNVYDDQPTDHMFYGWPALEVTVHGDMIVVYARSGETIFPEVRFSAYRHIEPDIRPSRLLHDGEAPYQLDYPDLASAQSFRWGDLAGASVDPVDDNAVWVVQAFASLQQTAHINNFVLWVGKAG
jgi:hypothetical protein